MASYQNLLQHTNSRLESPAKVFAKLKYNVTRQKMCEDDGIYTSKDPLSIAKDKHGAEFKSPRKRTGSNRTIDELNENRYLGSGIEATALTISPLSSPQKSCRYVYSENRGKPAEEMPPFAERGHGCIPKMATSRESASMSHPLFLMNRKDIYKEPPQTRDADGSNGTNSTPLKHLFVGNNCTLEKDSALMSSVSMFSPMRTRKGEPWEFDKVSSSTKEVGSGQPRARKTPCAFNEGETQNNTFIEERGFPAGQLEMNQLTREPMFSVPKSAAKKCFSDSLEIIHSVSPAKMFAYLKERENKAVQQNICSVSSSTRDPFVDNFHQSRDTPPSTIYSMGESENLASTSVVESDIPVTQSRAESADSQSDTDPSENDHLPTVSSQAVLLEDPLILNSPRINIPKKYEAVLKRINWPQSTKSCSESMIYLNQWFVRRNHKGLFVDGIRRDDNLQLSSDIIMERISNYVLKTVSGKVFFLIGKMKLDVDSGFPKWFLTKFSHGFPLNWKGLYEKLLLESRNRDTEREDEGKRSMTKTKTEASIKLSVKRPRSKPLKTSDSCPSSSSSTKVSRSGRVIKPPLEYWKGGRVILDAHMNVTIHECYDTSICSPDVTTTMSTKASHTTAHVFPPFSKDRKQCEPTRGKETSVPLRKVKAPLRRVTRTKVNYEQRPSYSPDAPGETDSSPEQWSGRRTRTSQRCQVAEKTMHVDNDPQRHNERRLTRSVTKQKHDYKMPSVRVRGRKQAVASSPESGSESAVDVKMSQYELSKKGLSIKRTKRETGAHRKGGEESEPSHLSEENKKKLNKRSRTTASRDAVQTTEHKRSKWSKTLPTKPLPKSSQSSKRHKTDNGQVLIPQVQDEDEWTEAELLKLKEAVAFYPKHVAGYWTKVARIVGTRSTEECHKQHTLQGNSQSPAKKAKKPKQKAEAPQDPDNPVISARAGTFKRKQQVRQFLKTMPKENVDDVFSCSYMQKKRVENPFNCPSSLSEDHDFILSDLEPMTPMSTGFPEAKTPQCLHITPGMMGSPNRGNDDKYVHQLQRRMKKSQFNVCKKSSSQHFTPTPSVKRTMRRCGNTENDNFVMWEMFPENDEALCDSREEEDFYFSDND